MKQETYSLDDILIVSRALGLKAMYKSYAFLSVSWKRRKEIKKAAKTADLHGKYAELSRYLTSLQASDLWMELNKPGVEATVSDNRIMETLIEDKTYVYTDLAESETPESIIAGFFGLDQYYRSTNSYEIIRMSDDYYNSLHYAGDEEYKEIMEDPETTPELRIFLRDFQANNREINSMTLYTDQDFFSFGTAFVPAETGVWRIEITKSEQIRLVHTSVPDYLSYIMNAYMNGPLENDMEIEEEKEEVREPKLEIKASLFFKRGSLILLLVIGILFINSQSWVEETWFPLLVFWLFFQVLIGILTLIVWKFPKERH
ncbi:hypothetical protein [Metabacillus sp. FJAT-52054]|uniref:Uncharacterized protein n=1 Tax=Metabacillus sediminis TaxID=3117746 RepID=A0ABZ2NGJ7_9BACI